jgi:phosphatidylethanolamine-binding protein (PEBP) family uncharacterized protein
MRFVRLFLALTMMLAVAVAVNAQAPAAGAQAPAMTLSTTAFPDGGDIPVKYSQAAPGAKPGEGTSIPLTWANAPAATQSFVLHMHDMEAARNKTTDDQVHWLVWNIPATAKGLPEGVPAALSWRTEAINSAPPARFIEVPEPEPTAPNITMCWNSSRWISNLP